MFEVYWKPKRDITFEILEKKCDLTSRMGPDFRRHYFDKDDKPVFSVDKDMNIFDLEKRGRPILMRLIHDDLYEKVVLATIYRIKITDAANQESYLAHFDLAPWGREVHNCKSEIGAVDIRNLKVAKLLVSLLKTIYPNLKKVQIVSRKEIEK